MRIDLHRPFAAALLALGLLAGCASPAPERAAAGAPGDGAESPVTGDWLRISESADPQTLNFVRAQDRLGKLLGQLVSDTLVQYDGQARIIGRLARSWEFSADRLSLTFHMRDGVRWHDGAPVTSSDAAYTIERILDPRSQAVSKRPLFETVDRIETPDPFTLRVHYSRPYAAALDAWTDAPLIPRHLYEKEPDFLDNPQCRAPVGCGPFRLVSWRPSVEVVLEANRDYWDGRPYLDRFIVKTMPQDSTRMQALKLGEIDALVMTPQQTELEARGAEFEKRMTRLTYTLPYLWYIAWNMDGACPFFTDRRVRQAMTYAIDRPGYIRSAWHGLAVAAASHIPPGSWAFASQVAPYPYDPERARALLDEAGWRDSDGDGVRDKGGAALAFTLLYPATGQTNDEAAAYFQENLRRVGARVTLAKMEFKTFLERIRNHQFQAYLAGLSLDVDPDPYDLFHSSQAKEGLNRASYSNAELDGLCERGRAEFDRERRREIYARVQQILSEDQPFTFILHPVMNVAIDRRFRGVQVSPVGLYLFWPGVSRWWVPREQQRFGPRS